MSEQKKFKTVNKNGEVKAQYRNLGTIRKTQDKSGNTLFYASFDKKVTILFDGKEVDLGEYGTLFFTDLTKAIENLDFKKDKGWLDGETYEKIVEGYQKKNVKYTLKAKLKD